MTSTNNLPIIIGHNDTLLHLYLPERGEGRSFFERSDKGHIDLPRAQEAGLAGGFFAIFVPPESSGDPAPRLNVVVTEKGYAVPMQAAVDPTYAQRVTIAMMADLFQLEAQSQGQLKVVRRTDELERCVREGVLGAILHFEGAEAIDPGLDALEVFYQAGLRSLGLVWSRPNVFAEGVPFRYPHSPDTGPGLTAAGKDLVRACNRLGIMLDLSHLNEQGFWDVAGLSDAPLVATHSNAHTISPSTRNLTDKQLAAIKDSQGVVGLNFSVGDLRADGHNDTDVPLAKIADHLDYLVEQAGIDHVALGTDFDGTHVPLEIGDVTGLPKLIEALRTRGYNDEALSKLAYQNWIEVLRKTWKA
jgi:membrane dipeptidase